MRKRITIDSKGKYLKAVYYLYVNPGFVGMDPTSVPTGTSSGG